MEGSTFPLGEVYEGWEGYQTSLVHTIRPLSAEQLAWRPATNLRSGGEIARHIALGRVTWLRRIDVPGGEELVARVPLWDQDAHGNQYANEAALDIATDGNGLADWLERSWEMVAGMLAQWTVGDLRRRYPMTWNGQKWLVGYQWTIWRIMAHDIHHGGELAVMLGAQGIAIPELGDLGGHLTPVALAAE